MLARTLKIFGLFGVLLACQQGSEETPVSASNLVAGADVHSPSANPTATYLKSRLLSNLTRLNALPGDLGRVAARVDSGLGPTPGDGVLTLDELIAVDQHLDRLLPQEKAALPGLWKLLETTKDDPTAFTVPVLDTILVTDASDPPAAELALPASIDVASLKLEMQRIAARLEQANDSDDNPKTITPDDVAKTLASPVGFQPFEIAQIKAIGDIFRNLAGTKLKAKATATAPADFPYTSPSPLKWGSDSIGVFKAIEYLEHRKMDTVNGTLTVTLVGHVTQHEEVKIGTTNDQLLFISEAGDETFVPAGTVTMDAGIRTIEIWNNGVRTGSYRASFPKLGVEESTVDLSQFIDYQFVLGDTSGTALERHSSDAGSQGSTAVECSFKWQKSGWDQASDVIRNGVATPGFGVSNGRYVIPYAGGDITIDLYPQGVFKVSRPDGYSQRAIFRNKVWTLPDGADLKLNFDPATGVLRIAKPDESPIFSGQLTGSFRTG